MKMSFREIVRGRAKTMVMSSVSILGGFNSSHRTIPLIKLVLLLNWKILNVPAMYQVGIEWVHCSFSCSVLAVYQTGTLPLAPSEWSS